MTVQVNEEVAAPLGRVWEMVSNFGGIARWHPLVERCESEGQGVGAVRRVFFRDWHAVELLEVLDAANHVMQYRVTDGSRPETVNVCGRIALTQLLNGNTAIEWSAWIEDDRADKAAMEQFLASNYRTRIGHLRTALGIQ